jgi:DHA1 family tetracycline resistance protein-like MFS transporter
MRRPLTLLFVFVFIDILGFSLILPLLPFYAQEYGATPTLVGLLLAANAATQLVGAPMLGRLSDRYGRRPMLILSIAGTAVSFVLLGLANSLAALFVSRLLDGLLGGDISIAQAYISDVTDEESRATGLGTIGAAFGLGFTFGPAIGGALSAGGNYSLPAFLAAGLSLLNFLGVLIWLPESLPRARRAERARSPRTALSLRTLWDAVNRPCVGPLLGVRFVYGLAFTIFTSIFALVVEARLGLDSQGTGYLLTYVGLLVVLVQGGGIRLLTRLFTDKQLVLWGSFVLGISLFFWGLAPSLWSVMVVLAPLALGNGVLSIASNSALTKCVLPEEVGGTLGLSSSLASLTRVLAPLAGGFLLDNVGVAAPGVIGGLVVGLVALYVRWKIVAAPDLVHQSG